MKSPLISETVRDERMNDKNVIGLLLLWNFNRKSDLCRFRWPWVTLKGGTRGVIFFRRISLITLVLFDLDGPNSWRIVYLGRQTRPYRKGEGPNFGGSLLFMHTPCDALPNFSFYVVTHVGRSVYLAMGSATPRIPRERSFSALQFWGFSCI